jgi:superkiller protein 3
MYARRNGPTLTFGKKTRRGSRWTWGLVLVLLAAILWMVTQFDQLQQEVLAMVGEPPAPTLPPNRLAQDAYLKYMEGEMAEAIELYKQAVAQDPKNVDYLFELARLLNYRSEKDRAYAEEGLTYAERAITANPGDPRGYAAKAMALDWLGRDDEAVTPALQALELAPGYAEAHAYLAQIYTDIQRWAQAREIGLRAVQLDPNSVDARYGYAYSLWYVGLYEEAIQQLSAAEQLHPNFLMIKFYLAALYKSIDEPQAAIGIYDRILTLDPMNVKAYTRLCATYFEIREDARAMDYCEQAKDLDPTYGEAHKWLGQVYYTRRNYESSIEEFQKCIEYGYEAIECWYLQGLAYYYIDRCDLAVPILTEARERPNVPEVVQTMIQQGFNMCAQDDNPVIAPTRRPTATPEPTPIGGY